MFFNRNYSPLIKFIKGLFFNQEVINNKMEKEEFDIKKLKKEYETFKHKYNLPEFSELNKLFDIEEIDEETDYLLRKIRRTISEKTSGYLRFIETLLNPSNAPIFFFKLVKKLESEDKEFLTKVYDILGNFEIEIIALELDYSEEKEAEFIKKIYDIFNDEIKGDFLKIIKKLENGDNDRRKENNGSYFG